MSEVDKSPMSFSEKLLQWFDSDGRKDLPWQINKTPYRVWVSEIMLQQTQVSTVIDYYLRFMESFPTVTSLADADEDKVLEHWSGLGYYARARNLHKAAKVVAYELNGDFPNDIDGLCELPGIGRSTAGAIRSIAFKQYAPILDGNVKRVLCRYYAIQSWSGLRETEKRLWQLADENTPEERNDDYTQAIMDLGATLCTRSKPKCDACPIQTDCQSLKLGLQSQLPVGKPKKAIPLKKTYIALIESENKIFLEKRPPSGIWGSLYSLPEISMDLADQDIEAHCGERFGGKFTIIEKHRPFRHTFSHYKLEIHPIIFTLQERNCVREFSNYHWIEKSELNTLGLPAPIAKYLSQLYPFNSNQTSLLVNSDEEPNQGNKI